MSLLEVEELEKYFPVKSGLLQRTTGYVKAVDGVSFSIDRGETLALIGESGSGKSTIARTIVGIESATGGTIRFDGEDITDPERGRLSELRSRIQMVFQDPTSCLNPRRTVGQTLSVPLEANDLGSGDGGHSERIHELLERVGLTPEYAYKYPHELSGGQKQRVNIARALAVEPDLLLLDEPTSALDVSVQAKIIALLEELQAEFDLTYLFITHDLSLVRNVADESAVLYLGRLQEIGPTGEVFGRPRHPYTQGLLSAIPVTSDEEEEYKPRKQPLEGEIPSPRDVPDGCRFHTRCPYVTGVCREVEPGMIDAGDGVVARCHVHDERHADDFADVPEVGTVAADGGPGAGNDGRRDDSSGARRPSGDD